MNSLLFVYGTLRKHEINHHLLAQSACINEQARTKGSMFAAKEGPIAALNGEGYIYGEVYEADELCIHKLDQFFQGYHKQMVFVETDVGIKNALIYFMNKDECAGFTKISIGDWKEHQMICKSKNPVYYFAYGSCMDHARWIMHGSCPLSKGESQSLFSRSSGKSCFKWIHNPLYVKKGRRLKSGYAGRRRNNRRRFISDPLFCSLLSI